MGMKFMHSKGILHNDLKEDNVIVFKNQIQRYFQKIIDLGESYTYFLSSHHTRRRSTIFTTDTWPMAMSFKMSQGHPKPLHPTLILWGECSGTSTLLCN
jgi:serine/threonine protein kinase